MLKKLKESGKWRLAAAAALLACALAIVAGLRAYHLAPWEQSTEGVQVTLPADMLYRISRSLDDLPASKTQAKAEWWSREGAIAMYERLAYQAKVEAAPARAKLAIIYGEEGYKQHASDLLAQLPTGAPDLVRAAVLLDWLYGNGQRPPSPTEAMSDVQAQFEPWVGRIVMVRLAKANGDVAEAARLSREDRDLRRTFLKGLVAEAGVYAALLLLGFGALIFWFWRWMKRPSPAVPVRRPPLLKPWRAMDAIEVWAVLLVAIAAAQGIALVARGRNVGELGLMALHVAGYAVTAALPLWIIARKTRGQTPGTATLVGIAPVRIGGLAGGVLAYAVFLASAVLAVEMVSQLGAMFGLNVPLTMIVAQTGVGAQFRGPAAAAMYGVLAVLVAPVVEETIFRGFIYAGLRRTMPVMMAVGLSAIMFATAHVGVSGAAVGGIAVLALGLAYTYERTRNLWICIGMHMIHNLLVFALLALAAL
jgi:membrane protease YdiL (CAAX protease family)